MIEVSSKKRRYFDDDTLRVAYVTQRFFTFSQFHGILKISRKAMNKRI